MHIYYCLLNMLVINVIKFHYRISLNFNFKWLLICKK